MKYMVTHAMLKDRTFDGWGWHDGLLMNFRGPNHYRAYLKGNGLIEAGNAPPPQHKEETPKFWDDQALRDAANIAGGLDGGTVQYLKEMDEKNVAEAEEPIEE